MTDEEIKYLVDRILQTEKIIDREFTDLMREEGSVEEYPKGYIETWIFDRLNVLYNLYLTYFETKGLPLYLTHFKLQFDAVIQDREKILDPIWLDPDAMEPSLKFLENLKSFREPFKDFDSDQEMITDRDKLLGLLKETDHILRHNNISGVNEPAIYKEVIWVVKLFFPTTRNGSRSGFINQFTVYKPDMFIAELKTAVEYKLVRKNANVEQFIDQVRIDATNYVDDPRYDNFIAVLVIDDKASHTEASIRQAWKEKKFPNNWTLLIVANHR